MRFVTEISPYLIKAAILDEDGIQNMAVWHPEDRLEDIYLGQVKEVQKNLNHGLITVEKAVGFLDGDHAKKILSSLGQWPPKKGHTFLVQVKKNQSQNKLAKLSVNIELKGSGMIFLPYEKGCFFSHKIPAPWRKELRLHFGALLFNQGAFLFRERAQERSWTNLRKEAQNLIEKWSQLQKRAQYALPGTCLYRGEFQDYFSEYVPEQDEWQGMDFKNLLLSDTENVLPPFDRFHLRERMEESCERLHLFRGGRLFVDELEGMSVIDVDSGGSFGGEGRPVSVNKEAAKAIGRLIRQRNLQGIIVVDFINMNPEGKNQVRKELEKALSGDGHKYKIHGFTALGLLEISREGRFNRLSEVLYETKSCWTQHYLLDRLFWFFQREKEAYGKKKVNVVLKEAYRGLQDEKSVLSLCASFGIKAQIQYAKQEAHFKVLCQ